MKSCNIMSAVAYLENLNIQLISDGNTKASALFSSLFDEITSARNDIANKSALAGALPLNIYNRYARVLQPSNNGSRGKTQSKKSHVRQTPPPTYTTVAGFTLGQVKEVEMSELLDLVGEIASHADSNRFGSNKLPHIEDIASMTKLLKEHLGNSGRRIKVELVNQVVTKTKEGETRFALGKVNRTTGVLSIAINPDPSILSNASLLVSTSKATLHEVVHAMTVQTLLENPDMNAKVENLRQHAIKAYTAANRMEPSYEPGSATYGLKTNAEFVAEAVTSADFQRLLAGVNPTRAKTLYQRVRAILNDIVKSIKTSIGISEDTYTLLDEAVDAVTAVLENDLGTLTASEQELVNTIIDKPNEYTASRGDVVSYNGKEYIVRGIAKGDKVQLTLLNGKNFSGTPSITNRSIKYIRSMQLHTHTDGNEYILDIENGKVYGNKGETNHSASDKEKMLSKYRTQPEDLNSVEAEDLDFVSIPVGEELLSEKDASSLADTLPIEQVNELLNEADEGYLSTNFGIALSNRLLPTGNIAENTEEVLSNGYKFVKGGKTFTTNEGQTESIEKMKNWFYSNDKPHFLLQGRGGTGKTTVISTLLETLNIGVDDVVFSAFMHKAVKVLEASNTDNKYRKSNYATIPSILALRPDAQGNFVPKFGVSPKTLPKVLVIDEVSTLRSDNYTSLLLLAKRYGTRIIFMGDHAQLPPVNDPNAKIKSVVFDAQKNSTTHLNQLMRQEKGSPIITLTDSLISLVNYVEGVHEGSASVAEKLDLTETAVNSSFGLVGEWFNKYDVDTGKGVIVTDNTFTDVLPHLVNDLREDITNTKYIHYNNHINTNTIEKTDAIRDKLFGKGEKDLYIKGEPLSLNNPYMIYDDENTILDNAEEFVVVDSKPVSQAVTYRVEDKTFKTDLKVNMYEITAYSKARDKNFMFLKPIEREGGDIHALIEKLMVNESPKVAKAMGNSKLGFLASQALRSYLAVDLSHSYVINTHKSQGSTYKNVYLDAGNILNINPKYSDANIKAKSLYVGASRASDKLVAIDDRYSGSVSGGMAMEDIPLTDYVLSDVNTVESTEIVDEVSKCKGAGN